MAKKQEETTSPVGDEQVPPVTKSEGGVNEGQVVQLPADVLQRILGQLDAQDALIAKQGQELNVLRDSVSQGKLLDAQNKNKPAEMPKAYLKVFMGKTVIGWKTEKAEMLYHPNNPNVPVGEVLKGRYFFLEGGDSDVVDQVLFTRCEDRVIVRLTNTKEELRDPNLREVTIQFEQLITSDEELQANYQLPDKQIQINKNFLNP